MIGLAMDEAIREVRKCNYERARTLLQGLSNDKEAQLWLAYLYQEGLGGTADLDKARETYQPLADADEPQGLYYLASLFLNTRQLTEAMRYFEKSAKLRHVSGAYWAAALHDGYSGYPKDPQKHLFFLGQAANLGHIFALRDMARLDMRNARNVAAWGKAFIRYFNAKSRGLFFAVRDPQDLRLR